MNRTIFGLELPEGTKCVGLTTLEPFCIVGAFDIPDEGVQIYVLNPNTGKWVRVEYQG